MSTELRLVRKLGTLRPADEESAELLRDLPQDVELKGEFTIPVNAPFRRKFFALLGVVWPHRKDVWPTREDFREQVLIALGFCRMVRAIDGTTRPVAVSMKWHKMKEPEFRALYEAFVDLCVTKLLPGVDREDVTREFEEVMAGYQNSLDSIKTHLPEFAASREPFTDPDATVKGKQPKAAKGSRGALELAGKGSASPTVAGGVR